MEKSSKKLWGLVGFVFAAVFCVLVVTNIHAETVDPVDDYKNTITGTVGIKYSAEDRAKAKAYYAALAFCYTNMNDIDDFAIYWGLKGKFGGDSKDGDDDSGEQLVDDFLNDIRGLEASHRDCSEGNLIKEAFDFFARLSKNGKAWDDFTMSDKQDLFCGWFRIGYDHVGTSTKYNDSEDEVGEACREAIAEHGENDGDDRVNYAFMERKSGGRPHLYNYINSNYFDGSFSVNAPYEDDEMYYVYASLMRHWCAEDQTGDKNVEHFTTSAFDVDTSSISISQNSKYFKIEHDIINPEWHAIENNGYDIDKRSIDCDDNLEELIDDDDDSLVVAAKDNLIAGYKEHCKKNYTDFYDEQTKYYNSLSYDQKTGEKASYVTWYNGLPKSPEERSCYKVSDSNPIFKCTVEEYVKSFQDKNPDPDAPGYSGYKMPESTTPTPSASEDGKSEKKTEPDCYSNAASLGWIMCPIIDQGGKFVTELYEKFIEPFMVLDSGLFSQKTSDGKRNEAGVAVYSAWSQFQNYANIAFIIVFLVVIFSQLTGYGIDNYGIKKILPKLIVAAVLINASYIICQLAIDAANIVGKGIKGILDGIGKVDISLMSLSETGGQTSGKAAGATVILVGLVALLVAPILLSKGIAILVPIFIAIIGVVIAVFTLFCTLAVRKAFAVVLVVISPLAFLCYMLPNTKKIFDRWLTAFKAVLLAFPICAGMVYGGQAVARIMVMASGGNNMPFLMVLSAAVMCVAPIFLIPGTLKKSMGAVTAAIDRVSRGASHRTRGAARNSSMSRDLERRGQMQRSGIKIGKDGQVQFTRRGKIQNRLPRSAASKRRIDAARADAIKGMSAESAAGSYMGAKGLERLNSSYSSGQAAIDKQRVSDLEASYKLGNQGVNVTDTREGGSLQKALQAAIMDGDADKIKALSNIATSQGDKGRSVVKNAVRHAEANAKDASMLKAGKKALASNIMDNYSGSYKENARSTYDWATANQSDGGGKTMVDAEAGVSTGSLRGSLLNSMDDADFELMANRKAELDQRISNGESLSDEQQADYDNIREAAYAAQHDQSFTGTKIERQKRVNDMVGDYKPKAVQEQEAAAAAQQDGAASKIATAIADEQQKREVNMYLSGMSQEERSALYHDNPARDGESMNEHIYRVAREHHENQQKNGK